MFRLNLNCCCCLLLILMTVGCEPSHPGNWGADQIAEKLAERLQASDVKLEPTEKGFRGTGKRADGEILTIDVSQFPERQEFTWTVEGDRGFVEEGFYGFGVGATDQPE